MTLTFGRDARIWLLALGYFAFYIPYSALVKIVSSGLLPGAKGGVSGLQLLPATVLGTAATVLLLITFLGWWKYVGTHEWRAHTALSGVAFAVIIATTTLAYTFSGISIVFALLLMRGGVLTLAPVVDCTLGRKVHWYSWLALGLSLAALGLALSDTHGYRLSVAACVNLSAYLAGYAFRLQFMTRNAKGDDEAVTRRYFVEENMAAMGTLVGVPLFIAIIGAGEAGLELRRGFTTFLAGELALPAVLIGVLYGCLSVFGTLVYLDRRENTFAIPVNRCASLLSGVVASFGLGILFHQPAAGTVQLTSAAIIILAMVALSVPLLRRRQELMERLFVFVCSGNTSRSPIAQAICNDAVARWLGVSSGIRAISAGLTADPGKPMTEDAGRALEQIGVPVFQHSSGNITADQVRRAERIFCMTEQQRAALIEQFPQAAAKTHRLLEHADIDDPRGRGPEAHLEVARSLQMAVRQRLIELGLAEPQASSAAG